MRVASRYMATTNASVLKHNPQYSQRKTEEGKSGNDSDSDTDHAVTSLDNETAMEMNKSAKELAADRAAMRAKREQALLQAARSQIKDMMWYAVFLFAFTFVLLVGRNNQMLYRFTSTLEENIANVEINPEDAHIEKTFTSISSVNEVYQLLRGPWYSQLYQAGTFDADNTFPVAVDIARNASTNTTGYNIDEQHGPFLNQPSFLLGQDWVVGGLRFGQTRNLHRIVPCNLPPQFDAGSLRCFDMLDDDPVGLSDEQRQFGYPKPIQGLHWLDQEPEDSEAHKEPEYVSPLTSMSYAAPDVWVMFPHPASPGAAAKYKEMVQHLEDNKFADLRTRALLLDLTVYNPSLDFVCVIRLCVEMPPSGGIVTSSRFLTVRVYRDYRASDIMRLIAEIVVIALVLRYMWLEIIFMKNRGFITHIVDFGNMPHILNLGLFGASVVYRILSAFALPESVVVMSDAYVHLRLAAFYVKAAEDINAFNAFLTWIKAFKYLGFIPKLKILLGTLARASGKISGFGFICMVVLFGSSQGFMLAFGTNLDGFRNMTQAFFTICRMLFGDFDFESLRLHSPFLGPVMFFAFTMLAVFVLVNMFIAIISDAFNETKAELEQLEDFGVDTLSKAIVRILITDGLYKLPVVGRFFSAAVSKANEQIGNLRQLAGNLAVMDLMHTTDLDDDGEVTSLELAATIDTDGDGKVTSDEMVEALTRVGTEHDEAVNMVALLDADHDGRISTAELHRLCELQAQGKTEDPDAPESGSGAGAGAGEAPRSPTNRLLSNPSFASMRPALGVVSGWAAIRKARQTTAALKLLRQQSARNKKKHPPNVYDLSAKMDTLIAMMSRVTDSGMISASPVRQRGSPTRYRSIPERSDMGSPPMRLPVREAFGAGGHPPGTLPAVIGRHNGSNEV